MNHDEQEFKRKVQKFSIVQKCPRCGHLSLVFRNNLICCTNCGYEEQIPTTK